MSVRTWIGERDDLAWGAAVDWWLSEAHRRIDMRNAGMRQLIVAVTLVVGTVASSGCKTAYYSTWEKLGWAKRDILVDRVKDAKEDQEAAKKQFQTALQQFQALTGFQGGE